MKDISLHLLDIVQNSLTADAKKVTISLKVIDNNWIEITVMDNGKGMDKETLDKAVDPFSTSRKTRKVGLGIPLFKASSQRSGGEFFINSVKGKGTDIKASYSISSIDRPPLGDIGETIACLILMAPLVELEVDLVKDEEIFKLNTIDLKERLGEVPLDNSEVITWIKEYINENVNKMFGGVLNEIIG